VGGGIKLFKGQCSGLSLAIVSISNKMQRADSYEAAWDSAKAKVVNYTTSSAQVEVEEIVGRLRLTAWDELIGLLCKEAEELGLSCIKGLTKCRDWQGKDFPSLLQAERLEARSSDLLREFEEVQLKVQRFRADLELLTEEISASAKLEASLRLQVEAASTDKISLDTQLSCIITEQAKASRRRAGLEAEVDELLTQIRTLTDLTQLQREVTQAEDLCFAVRQRSKMEQEDRLSMILERLSKTAELRTRVKTAVRCRQNGLAVEISEQLHATQQELADAQARLDSIELRITKQSAELEELEILSLSRGILESSTMRK
jgi:hypothetical protein